MTYQVTTPSALTKADFITLACLRDEVAPLADQLTTAVDGIRAWGRLTEAWEGQGILPLLAYRLDAHGLLDRIPPAVAASIRQIDAEYSRIGRIYSEETVACVTALLDAGIRCCVLKDSRGYPDLHLRPGYDLDLLVHPNDVDGARDRLEALGMEAEDSPYRSVLVDKVLGLHRSRNGLRIAVDLHWNILGGYLPRAALIDVEALFERSTTIPVLGAEIPVLGLEDHILNTSIHSVTHECRWPSRLITYLDTAEAIRGARDAVDWQQIISTATRWDALTDAQLGLEVARTILGAPVPADIVDAVRPGFGTLGLEASAFGYLGYIWKSVDKVIRVYGTDSATDILGYADTLLPAAREGAATVGAVAKRLSAAGEGSPVTAYGEAGALIPDPTLPAFGRIDLTTPPLTWDQMRADLADIGFAEQGEKLVRHLAHGAVSVSLAPSGERSRLNPLVSSAAYVRRVWARRRAAQPLTLDVRVIPGTPAEHLEYILGRYADLQAVDPPGIADAAALARQLTATEVARARQRTSGAGLITLDLVLACRARGGIADWPWNEDDSPALLDALNRRTASLEELTKFLGTAAGATLAFLLGGKRNSRMPGISRVVWSVLRGRSQAFSQARAFRLALTKGGTSRRVPPRIYLQPSGDTLVGLFDDPVISPVGKRAKVHG